MKTIWKYTLNITDHQAINIPINEELLSVQIQHGQPQLWALVDPEEERSEVFIRIYGTGHSIDQENLEYIDTFQAGPLVFHVFKEA